MLGLFGRRVFGACSADIADLGEEHGHQALKIRGKCDKTVSLLLPPAVARAIERSVEARKQGAILRNTLDRRKDRPAATRRLQQLSTTARWDTANTPAHADCCRLFLDAIGCRRVCSVAN